MHYVNAKGILSAHNGMNVYRGCTHGCIYCDARSTCYHMDHAFEDIEVKINAPELLRNALSRKRRKCMIGTGAMCDPYMPCEEKLEITKKCMEIINEYGFGAAVQTKSARILRDLDVLKSINGKSKCVVQMTITTYDDDLCKIIEPNVSVSSERFEALMKFKENNIPTVVWLSPILPFINDNEKNIRGVLDYCFRAGVKGIVCFNMGVTLREGDREYFYENLDRYFPGMKQRYQRKYGYAYELLSDNNGALMDIFKSECIKRGILYKPDDVFKYLAEFPEKDTYEQLSLFDI